MFLHILGKVPNSNSDIFLEKFLSSAILFHWRRIVRGINLEKNSRIFLIPRRFLLGVSCPYQLFAWRVRAIESFQKLQHNKTLEKLPPVAYQLPSYPKTHDTIVAFLVKHVLMISLFYSIVYTPQTITSHNSVQWYTYLQSKSSEKGKKKIYQ
jgi:hypothetical protein